MYSESDLQAAVDAKILTPEAAAAFRGHIASVRAAPGADEESFRLITGFNDIFVSIAAVILLVAVAWIGESIHSALAGAFVAALLSYAWAQMLSAPKFDAKAVPPPASPTATIARQKSAGFSRARHSPAYGAAVKKRGAPSRAP